MVKTFPFVPVRTLTLDGSTISISSTRIAVRATERSKYDLVVAPEVLKRPEEKYRDGLRRRTLPFCPGIAVPGIWPTARSSVLSSIPSETSAFTSRPGIEILPMSRRVINGAGFPPVSMTLQQGGRAPHRTAAFDHFIRSGVTYE